MTSEGSLKENLDHTGKSMEIVGAVGAAAGLAIAAFSGPIAMSAVLGDSMEAYCVKCKKKIR